MSKFQIITLIVSSLLAVTAVLLFTGAIPSGKGGPILGGTITVWGTFPYGTFNGLLQDTVRSTKVKTTYVEKDPATFQRDLVEALAEGRGPDLFFLPHDLILKEKNKIRPIPYEIVSEQNFRESFIEESSLFLDSTGVLALPVSVDPLVLYWNRDIFAGAGIAQVPGSWEELFMIIPKLTVVNNRDVITQSAIALGEFRNIRHSKDILALLIMQAGNEIVAVRNGLPTAVLLENAPGGGRSADSALTFYTTFANPSHDLYSWNRSLPNSRDMFIAENLAMYIGLGSERNYLLQKNPRLSLGVAPIPTINKDIRTQSTFGRMEGIAIAKNSDNLQAAAYIALLFGTEVFMGELEKITNLPPTRRSMLARGARNADSATLYDAAIKARGWADPDPTLTTPIFRDMIEQVTSGRLRVVEAIQNATRDLERVLRNKDE